VGKTDPGNHKCWVSEKPGSASNNPKFNMLCEHDNKLAYVGKASLDLLEYKGQNYWNIENIEVKERYRRQRLGTKLYELLAQWSCENGAPLMSTHRIGEMSAPFWAKQKRKGRATTVGKYAGKDAYALSCPAPKSLANLPL
jgi:GNAT superfamily N-acetyltransferase